MTNIAERIEEEYRNRIKETLYSTRKKGMIKFGIIGTISYGIAVSLPKLFLDMENIDTVEYIKLSAEAYPFILSGVVGIGALEPEIDKISTWMAYKPVKVIGKGIDYISDRFKR